MSIIDIAIGTTGEIDGKTFEAKAPENNLNLCQGCFFFEIERETKHVDCSIQADDVICSKPSRIFKSIII